MGIPTTACPRAPVQKHRNNRQDARKALWGMYFIVAVLFRFLVVFLCQISLDEWESKKYGAAYDNGYAAVSEQAEDKVKPDYHHKKRKEIQSLVHAGEFVQRNRMEAKVHVPHTQA